jgi:hypothetical protein
MPESVIDPASITVSLDHGVLSTATAYARIKIGHALAHAPRPVVAATVRIRREPHSTLPVAAAANVEMKGHNVHVDVAASTEWEAIDLLEERLRNRLAHV